MPSPLPPKALGPIHIWIDVAMTTVFSRVACLPAGGGGRRHPLGRYLARTVAVCGSWDTKHRRGLLGVVVVAGAAVTRGSRHGDLGPASVQRRHGLNLLENLSVRR
jgi:hypothetical protein